MTTTPVAQPDLPKVTLRSPHDLIAAVPYLLGFHPTDSVVLIGFHGRQLGFVARSDLTDPGEPAGSMARSLLETMLRQETEAVAVIGYGPAAGVDPLLLALRDAADRRGLRLNEVLRVAGGRWWSYGCDAPECCPPEGTPVDLAASEVSARMTFEGMSAAPSREDLARRVAPAGGLTRTSMDQATDRAEVWLTGMLAAIPEAGWSEALLAEGTAAVEAAIARYRAGGSLDDDELARLSLLLVSIPVRDVAWRAISTVEPHLRLWTDVTRRGDPELVAPPASLLAFTAWRAGDGVLAGLALERALRADPDYSLAHLLMQGLQQGHPPADFDDWGTPEWEARVERELRQRSNRRHRTGRKRRRQAGR